LRWRRRRSHGRLVGTFWSPRSAPRPQEVHVKMIPGFARCRIVGLRSPQRPWAARREQLSLFSVRPRVALAPSTLVGLVVFGVLASSPASRLRGSRFLGFVRCRIVRLRSLDRLWEAREQRFGCFPGCAFSRSARIFGFFGFRRFFVNFERFLKLKNGSWGTLSFSGFSAFSACSRSLWRLVLGRSRPTERLQS